MQNYTKAILAKQLILKNNYKNSLQIPKLVKIVISTRDNAILSNPAQVALYCLALQLITGQKSVKTRTTKSIASFRVRKNDLIGAKVTLRNFLMYNFIEKLTQVVLPSLKDFKKIQIKNQKNSLDIGIKDLLIFPELEHNYELFLNLSGLQVTIETSAKNKNELKSLLSGLNFPLLD